MFEANLLLVRKIGISAFAPSSLFSVVYLKSVSGRPRVAEKMSRETIA